jgi:hypothetical protein
MFLIGIDSHRGSHAAAVLDRDERVQAVFRLAADRQQRQRLVAWASEFEPRSWASRERREPARCWPNSSSPPVRRWSTYHRSWPPGCGWTQSQRQDRHPRRPLHRHRRPAHQPPSPRQPRGSQRRAAAAGEATPRPHRRAYPGDLPAPHDRVLVEGHLPRRLRADRAVRNLAGIQPTTAIDVERKMLARELLAEVRRLDRELADHVVRIRNADASGTTLTELHGVGPIVAAYVFGYSGDTGRFPSAGHYARHNATAPIEASSEPRASAWTASSHFRQRRTIAAPAISRPRRPACTRSSRPDLRRDSEQWRFGRPCHVGSGRRLHLDLRGLAPGRSGQDGLWPGPNPVGRRRDGLEHRSRGGWTWQVHPFGAGSATWSAGMEAVHT